jgi:PAP2 superfamily
MAPTGQPDDPATIGIQTADAVIAARTNDGANQAGGYADTSGYTPTSPAGPLTWQPLPGQSFAVPHWQQVTSFALSSASQFLPPGPGLKKSDGSYDKAIKAVIDQSAKLDDQSKARAEYWADGPKSEQPPGHWHLFAGAISRKHSQTIDQDTKLNFAVSNALLDAGITAWNAKRRYDFIRPVTAVRTTQAGKTIKAWAGPGQGTKLIPAEQFRSYIPTPPFPDYVSGHSTFSAAAAQVLRSFTGSDTLNLTVNFAAGSSFVEPGTVPAAAVPMGWSTFTAAAGEAGLSREFGGIHFRDANAHGLNLGRAVGTNTGIADQALLGVAGKAMLMPVQATVQAVLGGQLAFGIDIAAVDAHRGDPTNRARSAVAWSLILVARTSASTPRSAATRSTSANAAGRFGQCSTYSTSTTRFGRLSSNSDGMPSSPRPGGDDQTRTLALQSNR